MDGNDNGTADVGNGSVTDNVAGAGADADAGSVVFEANADVGDDLN